MKPHVERLQLSLIKEKVARIEQHSEPHWIINLYGLPGLGKTSLLQHLFEALKQDAFVLALNFDPAVRSHPTHLCSWHEVLTMLQKMALLRYLPTHITIDDETQSVHDVPLACQTNMEQAEAISAPQKPVILLLDNLDTCPYWRWLQEHVLKPIFDQEGSQRPVFLIATSQGHLRWHFWELREQCHLEELEPFSYDETRRFLQLHEKEQWTDTLYQVTGGYPLGLVDMLGLLANEGADATPESIKSLREDYRRMQLQQITQQQHEKMPANVNLEEFLESIVSLGSDFDLTRLRRQSKLPPGRIHEAVALLDRRGFFSYDRQEHTYQLKPVIARLYQEIPQASQGVM
jgi:hypothetical protein